MFVCLFDIDGTLLHSGGAGRAAMEEGLSRAFGIPVDAGKIPFSGRTDRAIARDLFQQHGVADTPENWQRFLESYLRVLPACLGRYQGKVLPGITALLADLANRQGFTLGLLTGNVQAGAHLKLGHYGLHHFFAFGGYGDLHCERDDVARAALAEAHRHLGMPPLLERVWVIGDTPHDIRCARAIGGRVAAVATGWHSLDELAEHGPDLLLADLADPAPWLTLMY